MHINYSCIFYIVVASENAKFEISFQPSTDGERGIITPIKFTEPQPKSEFH